MTSEHGGIHEDGILWEGTRDELEAWKQYKREKALKFIQRGYSVEWSPDGHGVMAVYLPERHYAEKPEVRADIKFFSEPSKFGIQGGKVSKLSIHVRRSDILLKVLGGEHDAVETLYNFDRGQDVDRLNELTEARRLFDAIYDELN